MSATKLIEPSSFIRVPMVERPECAGCGETDCENERCDNPRCDGGCIGSCNCARCDGDFCTNCEIGGDGEDENDWVCDNCVDELNTISAAGPKPSADHFLCDHCHSWGNYLVGLPDCDMLCLCKECEKKYGEED